MNDIKDATIREPYEPPTLEDVPVRAEERLLAGCKNTATSVPGFSCVSVGVGGRCMNFQAS
jgi:hypothetical protein